MQVAAIGEAAARSCLCNSGAIHDHTNGKGYLFNNRVFMDGNAGGAAEQGPQSALR